MWRISLLLCFVAGSRQLSITEFEVPATVQLGEDVHIKCKYELGPDESDDALFVKWWWTPLNSSTDDRFQLYQRIAGRPADVVHSALYSSIHVEENDGLMLMNVTPNHSGSYECEVSNIDEIRKKQEMVVFSDGDGPQLNITLLEEAETEDSDDDILVTCKANDVAPEPELIITVNGEAVSIEEFLSPAQKGMFDVTATVTLSRRHGDGADIGCELVYKDANISHPQYLKTETFYADQAALSTSESPDDTTTEASLSLDNPSGADGVLASCCLLILSAFTIPMIMLN